MANGKNESGPALIQWYPGHMTKAKRAMEEDLRKVDLLIELLDARAVRSSGNPDIGTLASSKYRIVVLSKSDLADEETNKAWLNYYKERSVCAVALDSRQKNGLRELLSSIIPSICAEKIEKARKKGILNVTIRAMVAGIPNVGKSTLINSLSGKASLETGDKPGVTRSNRWIKIGNRIELLDTPGLLWPKFDDPATGLHLAYLGSVSRDILNPEELAFRLLSELAVLKPDALGARYGIDKIPDQPADTLALIASKRGCLRKGGSPDTEKAANLLLDDFKAGKFGRISLEKPDGE